MKIHFIGIGGIGVSALAKYYLAKRYQVSGCDLARSEITDQLKTMGARVRIGKPHKTCIPPNTAKLIFSPAVRAEHAERQEAAKKNIPSLTYPEALGELTKIYDTIAISGTHGKSTTTSMIGLLLTRAGLDPTVIVGTKLKEFGDSNCRVGKGKYLVIEADEHFASFLNYWPKIIVLTAVEADHLDYWKTLKNLLKGFQKYTTHIPQDGTLVANKDDKNTQRVLNLKSKVQSPKHIQYYSLKQPEARKLRKMLKIPGEHNVSNALAALTVARILGIKDTTSFKALGEFHGTWRRFEIFDLKIGNCKLKIISDYGHHPTEVKVTVEAAREKWPKRKIWLVFQPHQYQRTYYLWKEFVKVLSTLPIEKLVLIDIYDVAGREEGSIRKKVSSEKLVKAIQATSYPPTGDLPKGDKLQATLLYIPTIQQVEQYLQKNLRGGEIVMVMGAGNIYNLTLRLTQEL